MIPVAVERDYTDSLMRLCRIGDALRSSAPVPLPIVGSAGDVLERWYDDELEPRRHREFGELGATEAMAAWAARLHGLAARIAAVIHVCEYLDEAAGRNVEPEAVERAITICEWATSHAFAAFDTERLDRVSADALRVRRWYRVAGLAQFTVNRPDFDGDSTTWRIMESWQTRTPAAPGEPSRASTRPSSRSAPSGWSSRS